MSSMLKGKQKLLINILIGSNIFKSKKQFMNNEQIIIINNKQVKNVSFFLNNAVKNVCLNNQNIALIYNKGIEVVSFHNIVIKMLVKYIQIKRILIYFMQFNSLKPQIQYQIDITLSKLGKQINNIQWCDVTYLINQKYDTNYQVNQLISRYQGLLQDLPKYKLIQVLQEFQYWKSNFILISQTTGVSIYQIKRQIMKLFVNNIWKVCFIARKRKISNLKTNFISNKGIKELVVMMLKPDSFKVLLDQYNQLWKFISHYYEDTYFQNIKNQIYKLVYRQLIILTQKFKIATDIQIESELTMFQRNIIAGHRNYNGMKQESLCSYIQANLKKKKKKETINLVSDEDNSDSGEHFEIAIQDRQAERQADKTQMQTRIKILRQIAITRLTIDMLSQLQSSISIGQNIKRQMALLAVRLAILQSY